MVWSHCYCMTSEPGFIPINYKYNVTKLPSPFSDVIAPDCSRGGKDVEMQKLHVEHQSQPIKIRDISLTTTIESRAPETQITGMERNKIL